MKFCGCGESPPAMLRIILAALALLAACDPCDSAAQIHYQRCIDGDQASCEWLAKYGTPSGTCAP